MVSREKAHERGVRCLRLAELFGYKRVLFSGGGDGIIKLWDIKFNEISRKDIREELYAVKMGGEAAPSCPLSNIDIYQCSKKLGNQHPSTLVLVSAADGSILEAKVYNEFQGLQAVNLSTAESKQLKEKINFDIGLMFAGPPNYP